MKIGIVGSGTISGHHLSAASRYRRCEIVGIADRDIARARAQAARFSVPRSFDNLADLLRLKPDIVHVLTPPDAHESLVLEALGAGAHVYVEKPMAISETACENMRRAAARAKRELCVGHSLLYTPVMVRAQQILASGVAGQILHAEAGYYYDVRRNPTYGKGHWAKELPGGLAEDLAVHLAAILIRLLGTPQRTLAASRTSAEIPEDKTADVRALLDCEHGLGTLSVSLRARPDVSLVDIWCTRMLLRLNISSMSLTVHRDLAIPRKIARALGNVDVAAQLVGGTLGTMWQLFRKTVDGSYGIVPLIHAFYAAIEAGQPAPVGPAEGARVVAVMRSIWPAVIGSSRVAVAQ
jgi:predicted dehydrogenase